MLFTPQSLTKSTSSPTSVFMSSQPSTPRPTMGSPRKSENEMPVNHNVSPILPLESQKQSPVTPNPLTYSPSSSLAVVRKKRNDSLGPNDGCPSFGSTEYAHNVYSLDRHTVLDVRLQTKVDRGFFLADNDWTCYRRNYFQVSGSFSLEGVSVLYEGQELPCLVKDEHGNMNPVQDFMLGICGRLSDCDKTIPLIQHTAKRDKGPQTTPQPKVVRPGGNVSFSSVSSSQTVVTFERLQFKTATANNGKRRAAQQYYVIVFELLAKLTSGHIVPIASSKSAPVVVRGRSPGHYAESDSSNGSGRMASSHNLGVVRHHPYAAPPGHSAVAVAANTAPYPGANTDMFQPNEYMPYDYHSGVPYGNYGHMQPMPHSNHSYPGSGVPVMSQHQQQQQQPPQQQHYVHDRTHHHPQHQEAYPPPHPNHNYEDHKLSSNEASNGNSSNNSNNNSSNASPYYWQRNDSTTNNNQQPPPPSLHESNAQWSRVRMASNNSSSSVDSPQHNSPYINHAEHPYYSQQQQQHQAPYGGHPYAAGHPVSSPHGHHLPTSLPPPPPSAAHPPQADHYPGYPQHPYYDWQNRQKAEPVYSHYESERKHEYSIEREGEHIKHEPYTPLRKAIAK